MEKANEREVFNLYNKWLRPRIKNKSAKINFERQISEGINLAATYINDPYHKINRYHIFKIYEPKERLIMSLNIPEKICNHYFTRNVLMPKLEKYLDPRNCATRKGMGTEYAISLVKKYVNKLKSDKFYVLKIDISKYFYNIDHKVLKDMLKDILTKDEYIRLCNLLDSTNRSYINKNIINIGVNLPTYKYDKGLPIGNLSSQTLSVFYLYKLDHYIVHNLHLKYYVRYMDDFLIFSKDKDYLKKCLDTITKKLKEYYKLDISPKKTFIIDGDSFNFLGYHFYVNRKKNNKLIVSLRKETRDKIRKNMKRIRCEYRNNIISFEKAYESVSNYLYSYGYSYDKTRNYFDKYFC